ncbi:MAG: SMP-30/gluconolactonase/LRE family protein [Mycobacteriales bacterium]|nr:SMP-30/gluconolactonase/LRE family protein [Frankia sp.]
MPSEWTVVGDRRATLGEGPLWDERDHRLWWVDILGRTVFHLDAVTGASEAIDVPQEVGALALRAAGGLVAAGRDGFAGLSADGRWEMLAPVEADRPDLRMNDGRVDPRGRFWASTMSFDETPGSGTLYRLDPDLSVHPQWRGLTIGNGVDWSPDGRWMYFVETSKSCVFVAPFDVDAGTLGPRSALIDLTPALPDGLCVDAAGDLWVGIWDGGAVRCFDAAGAFRREIRLPVARVTSCAFGGPGLDELFVTTASVGLTGTALTEQPLAGALFRCQVDAVGRAQHRFAG